MSEESVEAEKLALQYYKDQARVLKSFEERGRRSGFEVVIQRLVGDNPKRGRTFRIGNCNFNYSSHTSRLISFLPSKWQLEFKKSAAKWRGCENWWAGYPLIVWVEIRVGDDGYSGDLTLNAEVGPVAPPEARRGIIDVIKAAASMRGTERVRFAIGASEERQLYSRFLRKNSIAVLRIQDAEHVESKFAELISDFEPEFGLIMSVIPQLMTFKGT